MHAMTGSGLREISTLWRRAFREGDGIRWALVRRARELVGIERLEQQVSAQAQELSRLAARPEVIHPVPDPQPPFNAGSPSRAPTEVVELLQKFFADR